MSTLLVGFDSAWTPNNSGAVVGVLLHDHGTFEEFGPPRTVNYREAERVILDWQAAHVPTSTLVFLDQPTIVENAMGQRPVESIVCSAVSLRYGGMQPANTSRSAMFGADAPLWAFLARFGGAADPLGGIISTGVFETYPVLAMIALGWILADPMRSGRLTKYNPERKKTFSLSDWNYVCRRALSAFSERGLTVIAE